MWFISNSLNYFEVLSSFYSLCVSWLNTKACNRYIFLYHRRKLLLIFCNIVIFLETKINGFDLTSHHLEYWLYWSITLESFFFHYSFQKYEIKIFVTMIFFIYIECIHSISNNYSSHETRKKDVKIIYITYYYKTNYI